MDNQNAVARRRSVFLPSSKRGDVHIVDELIEERCPSFVDHWTWPMVRPVLHTFLGYDKAVHMADTIARMTGRASFDYLAGQLDFRMINNHMDRLPKDGRVIIAANHPTGLADGVAAWQSLSQVRQDILFFANADALRVNAGFEDTIIPVEWVLEKRSTAKTKETLRRAREAFNAEKCVVIFPSGRLANMVDRQLMEKEWFTTVVTLARKQNCPILPLNLQARNSRLYYTLSNVNAELRDITLFYELLNKRRSKFELTFGPLIDPASLQGDPQTITDNLRDYVSYKLPHDPHQPFAAEPATETAS